MKFTPKERATLGALITAGTALSALGGRRWSRVHTVLTLAGIVLALGPALPPLAAS